LHLVWSPLILDLVVRSNYNLIIHMANVRTLAFLSVVSTFQFPIRVAIGMAKNSYRLNVLRASHLHRGAELPASTILIFKYLVKVIFTIQEACFERISFISKSSSSVSISLLRSFTVISSDKSMESIAFSFQ
jgi:hypothetical protein